MKQIVQILILSVAILGYASTARAQTACTAGFTYVIIGDTVYFTNTSVASPGATYYWDFADFNSSTQTNPAYAYQTPGFYQVCLTVTDTAQNCSDTHCTLVQSPVDPFCYAFFDTSVVYNEVLLANASVGGSNYQWNFGDNTTSSAFDPQSHTYSATGTYNICLVMVNSSTGCSDTFCTSVTISALPPPCNSSFSHQVTGNTVQFINNSSGGQVFSWTFGDDSTSSAINPQHTYSIPGLYPVCLAISDSSQNCFDYYCDTILVGNPSCYAYFTCQGGGNTFTFTNSSSGGTSYLWDFGDTTSSTLANPTHTFANIGAYPVCLTITDSATGCSDSYCSTITVTSVPGCTANFMYFSSSDTVTFVNSGSPADYYYWDFGDGNTSTQASPVHVYSSPGNYFVCLVITSVSQNCTDSYCELVTVGNPTCSANFAYSASGNTVQFIDLSVGGNYYTWSFGDNTTSTQISPTHNYSSPGTYQVCLVISDINCNDTVCYNVAVGQQGVSEAAYISSFEMNPNPFSDVVSIICELQQPGEAIITVFDILGNKVDEINAGRLNAGPNKLQWNGSGLKAGVYMVRISTKHGSATRRVAKIR